METINKVLDIIGGGLGSLFGIAIILGICAIPFLIAYFIIKKAVKNGMIEAWDEIKDEIKGESKE